MNVILDIVGSVILAGLIILAMNNGVAELNETTYEQTYSLTQQTNIVALARIIEHDFVKIGYRAPDSAIVEADSQSITFRSDLYNDDTLRTVTYTLCTPEGEPVSEVANPAEMVLFREVTGETPAAISSGLVEFSLTYFDSTGRATSSADEVHAIAVRVELQTPEPVDEGYPAVFWEKTIYPRNL